MRKKKDRKSSCINQFLSFMLLKSLSPCQKFPIILFLEQKIQCNILRKAIFQIILSRNLSSPLISQLRKKEPKQLLLEPTFLFHVDQWAYFLRNISNILVFGTDIVVSHFNRKNRLNNSESELVRSCNFPIKKTWTQGAPTWTNLCFWWGL